MYCPCDASEIDASLIRLMSPSSQGNEYCSTRIDASQRYEDRDWVRMGTYDVVYASVEDFESSLSFRCWRLASLHK